MALKTFVKISNVNNLSDARYCSGMYVNLMGFSLEESDEYYVTPTAFKEITDWLSGLEYVAEFSASHPATILETMAQYEGFSYIQIDERLHLPMLKNTSYSLIFKYTLKEAEDLEDLMDLAPTLKENDILLNLESDTSVELTVAIQEEIKKIAAKCDLLLGFGFDDKNIDQLLDTIPLKGISMKAGHEIKPGIKDFDELADILEAIEVED
ncbi:phosphoribosylanthranilate isomerase [uncultured Cyclobacterium sp.]|uniref:phosphoribosylanthranilate isomerase n=1 Tax=uncultured Cyclobacterium sp. TaxID=453820 RepID=UPI0030ED1EBE|tara:strand:+ start:17074 stop:17703 length:630 start_codon:yes stop_codon:yes gene_type:complete